jgi:tripartite-type tricarboxylate transporter receptor subunit TctC
MITRRQWVRAAGSMGAASVLGLARPSWAADAYPARPVRLVVGLAPGGIADQVARITALHLSDLLGQQVIVETRSGAGGAIAAKMVRDAAPDGYTLGIAFDGTFATAVAANPQLGFDPVKEFAAIGKIVDSPVMVTAYNDFPDRKNPAHDLGDLIRRSRTAMKNGLSSSSVLDYGTSGVGSTGHLTMELIKRRTGIYAVHIPYRGGGEVRMHVLGKQLPLMLAAVAATSNDVRTGALKGLAVTSLKRCAAVPEVPTLSELGIPELEGLDINSWVGLVAPLRTPADIVARLNEALRRMLGMAEVEANFTRIGAAPIGNSPAEFSRQIAGDVARWKGVIRDASLQM